MKIYYCIFLLLSAWPTFGQLVIDSTTRESFKAVASSPNYKIMAKAETEIYQNKGVAVITNSREDTLNHNDYIVHKPSLNMVEVDLFSLDSLGKETKINIPSDREKNIVVFAKTKTIQDTLCIIFNFPDPYGNYTKNYEISLYFKANKPNVLFVINDSKENSFRKQINTKSKNRILLIGRLNKFVLDRIPKIKNEELYGEVNFITEGYFETDKNFKTGYLHKRNRVNLYFKCKL